MLVPCRCLSNEVAFSLLFALYKAAIVPRRKVGFERWSA
jgi:hypothetical protein